ncbi:MAG: UpxY family transcription antiterminator [Bacteroidales bacterium]|nr:UpxY family transcription antiterminator [Bacteroidales bacterium]
MAASARIASDPASARWYAARVHHGVELKVRDRLASAGVEHFIPTERRRKTRGKGVAERPRISALVFIRATKREALELAGGAGLPVRYIVDCATRTLLVVPDKEMEDFRRVLDLSVEEGGLMDAPLSVGARVRVTKGALKGVEGYVLELQGRTYVVVGLLGSLFAKARVPRAWLEKVKG